jgi:hypothetical protein
LSKIKFKLDKSPTVVGDRMEKFGNIFTMISQWVGMEEREEGEEV